MGQDREDERLRQEVAPPRRSPRPEDDPVFRARRQQADLTAGALRRRARLVAFLWFCGFQWLGAAIGFSSFHARNEDLGWAILYLGYFIGNGGAFLTVWWFYLRRENRGDW